MVYFLRSLTGFFPSYWPNIIGCPKKVSWGKFQDYRDYLQWIFFCNKNFRQSTLWANFGDIWPMSKLSKLHLWMAISAIKSNIRKIFFCKKIYYDIVVQVPNFHLSAKSSSFFCAFFLHFYGVLFCGHPISISKN